MMVVQIEGIEIDTIEENDHLMKADIGTVKLQEIETDIRMKDIDVIQEINKERDSPRDRNGDRDVSRERKLDDSNSLENGKEDDNVGGHDSAKNTRKRRKPKSQ